VARNRIEQTLFARLLFGFLGAADADGGGFWAVGFLGPVGLFSALLGFCCSALLYGLSRECVRLEPPAWAAAP